MKNKKEFNINVSQLSNYSEEEIKKTLKLYTKRDLLESVLNWQMIAKNWESKYNELELKYELINQ